MSLHGVMVRLPAFGCEKSFETPFVMECVCKVILGFSALFHPTLSSGSSSFLFVFFVFFCAALDFAQTSCFPHFGVAKGLEFATQIIGINRLANHCICSPSICVSQYMGRRGRKNS